MLAAYGEGQVWSMLVGQHCVRAPPMGAVEAGTGDHVHGGGLAVAGLVAVDQLGAHRPALVELVPAVERVLLLELTAVGDQP
ncbi:hypothetical protein D3C81_1981650 [compost metagenome]